MNRESKKLKLQISTMMIVGFVSMSHLSFSQDRPQGEGERKERPSYAELLTKMDTNKDGKLAQSEVKGPLKDHFSKIDVNEDGFVTEEEFTKAPKPKNGQRPPRN